MVIFFLFFTCLTSYCFMNLIVGVFVENTLSIAQGDAQKILAKKERQHNLIANNIRGAFESVDSDGSGCLAKKEFQNAMRESVKVQEALTILGLDQIEDLFDRIDTDRSGVMTVEEF